MVVSHFELAVDHPKSRSLVRLYCGLQVQTAPARRTRDDNVVLEIDLRLSHYGVGCALPTESRAWEATALAVRAETISLPWKRPFSMKISLV